jgi:hypothetical protein
MSATRRISTHWTCAECKKTDFGITLRSDATEFMRVPDGWWFFPIDHGDSDGEDGRMMMIHAFCSEDCIDDALARKKGEPKIVRTPPAPKVVNGVTRGRIPRAGEDTPTSNTTSPRRTTTSATSGPLQVTMGELLRKKT